MPLKVNLAHHPLHPFGGDTTDVVTELKLWYDRTETHKQNHDRSFFLMRLKFYNFYYLMNQQIVVSQLRFCDIVAMNIIRFILIILNN